MYSEKDLFDFIDKAGKATYAGGGSYEKHPERSGFNELIFLEGDWNYRDSYTGFTRSRGMEVVRFKGNPVWSSSYGGGMVEGKEKMANEVFGFLKKAMSQNEMGFDSFRGPHTFIAGDWEYSYSQEGDVIEFSGSEEIKFKNELVFFHKMIGGEIK